MLMVQLMHRPSGQLIGWPFRAASERAALAHAALLREFFDPAVWDVCVWSGLN